MNDSAQKFFCDERPLDTLADLGVISQQIVAELRYQLEMSRTGRVFGHPSAVDLPNQLEKLAEICSLQVHANDDESQRVRSIFDRAFTERRPRRVTFLNLLLKSIESEISGYQASGVAANDGDEKPGFFKRITKIFGR